MPHGDGRHALPFFRRLLGLKERPRLKCHRSVLKLVRNKSGIEFGGPSPVFRKRGLLPLYPYVGTLDNCNFGSETVWEGRIEEGSTFRYHRRRKPGRQFVAEASCLPGVGSGAYEFILSSHLLEHAANPLATLAEWFRLLVPGGCLVLVLPHREGTFDHRRPVTTLEHLVDDFCAGTGEDDQTHLPEILKLHDLARDEGSADFETFRSRTLNNVRNRCVHHHVFDTALAVALVDRGGFRILHVETALPHHIFVIATRPATGLPEENREFLSTAAEYRSESVFASDRYDH